MAEADNLNRFRPADNLDADLQRELDEALGDMTLEQIIQQDERGRAVEPLQGKAAVKGVKRGHVVSIQGDDIFVDMGGKSQGILPATQFGEDEPLPKVGDPVDVTIEGYDTAEGLLVLSRQGAVLAAAWETLEEGQIVEARITGHNKGGLECSINGIDAFMPFSQVERFRVEDLAPYVNQKLKCQVLEVDPEEHKVVLSRRAVLELELQQAREQAWETIAEGQTVEGVVRNIMPYGAFIDLGSGIDGLLHIGEMSFVRVEDPKTVVTEGQKIQVKIVKVDREARKLSLSLKACQVDPWTLVPGKYRPDEQVTVKITRLADFGAFAELEPGVEGLVPISEITFERRLRHPDEVLKVGQMVRARVMNVEPERKRISLSVKRVGDDPWVGASARWPVNAVVTGTVRRTAEFGAFVELTPGVEGLVHISEVSPNRIRKVEEAVKEGQSVQVKVLSVDEDARRMSLSIKQVAMMPDYTGPVAAEGAEPAAPPPPPKKRKKPLKGGLE